LLDPDPPARRRHRLALDLVSDLLLERLAALPLEEQFRDRAALLLLGVVFAHPSADHVGPAVDGLVPVSRVPVVSLTGYGISRVANFFMCSSFSILASSLKCAFCSGPA
jgi:hypothetical protein